MGLGDLIRDAVGRLAEAGIPSPQADAELLAAHVWSLSRAELQAKMISDTGESAGGIEAQDRFWALIGERQHRIPLQHLTGMAPFRWLELKVGPGVFIPRPETETVVDLVLHKLRELSSKGISHPRVVDLGTGSGAIAASIALEYPAAEVHAVEVSTEAAAWAQLNFDNLPQDASSVILHHCDLRDFAADWRSDPNRAAESFDLVVSNPPYIPPNMVPVEQEVREHDPDIALYGGGPDGLDLPTAVLHTAKEVLASGGWLVLEHAEVQADALAALCSGDPMLEGVETHWDLTGRKRATSATIQGPRRGAVQHALKRTA
ncbi:peptide chain release factor N(5)-glutamine methyltransferase [Nesterenkonia salmonea]|uniref:peptide chain release factor N(5)-glutamine methyltransferase n=1 Tax=Nesterenkonia salmonea TaxID=1804987 RepID=UPI001FB69D23|nr:peptide chain release factor N(5)-glutamine methyltransferase [Nesterenkonia salmonea]